MNHHRFVLQPYRGSGSRFRCPGCKHHNKTFTRYIDLENYAYLADHVGRCDREDKCSYHFTPSQYFALNRHYYVGVPDSKPCKPVPVKQAFSHLPATLMQASMVQKAYIHNNFICFLAEIFSWETALQAAEKYNIGTSKHWPGATVFWQVDKELKIHTGKIMLYDANTCKRVKKPFNHVTWAHVLVGKS